MLSDSECSQFAAAMAELGVSVHKDYIASHDNTLQDFIKMWGKPAKVFKASNGVEVHIWKKLKEGKSRIVSDVYAADFGATRAFHIKN